VLPPTSSTSYSITAALATEGHHHTRLTYTYRNQTRPGVADVDMNDHDGTAEVVVGNRAAPKRTTSSASDLNPAEGSAVQGSDKAVTTCPLQRVPSLVTRVGARGSCDTEEASVEKLHGRQRHRQHDAHIRWTRAHQAADLLIRLVAAVAARAAMGGGGLG
jgi:hypothetical protein